MSEMILLNLATLIQDMRIPDIRRDLTKPENIRWLLRNLSIENKFHPNLEDAIAALIAVDRRQKRS